MLPRFALAFSHQVSYQALRRCMPAQLEARRLRKTYGGRVLLDGVDLRLAGGSITTLSGPSGSGKTTLLRILGLLSDPDEGQLLLDGVDARILTPHAARRRIALVAQAPVMFPGTVLNNVRTGPRLAGEELPEVTARELVVRAGLPPELLTQDAQSLSGGEKLRVAVARALALRPEAWLLDEPTAALDSDRAALLVRLLRGLAAEGAPILVVTHDARTLEQLEGPHFQLASGRLVEARPLSGAAS
jgi:ABC-type multidrug transport system ATPase subunit